MPRGGSSGFSPGRGRKPARRVAIHFLKPLEAADPVHAPPAPAGIRGVRRPRRASSCSRESPAGRPPSARCRPRRAGERAFGLEEREALQVRDQTFDVVRARGPTSTAGLLPRHDAAIVWRTRSRSSSGPGRSKSKRTSQISSSSGRAASDGPTRTIVRRRALELLRRLAERPQRRGVLEVRLRVLQQPDAVLPGEAPMCRSATPRSVVCGSSAGWQGESPEAALQVAHGEVQVCRHRRARAPRNASPRPSRRRPADAAIGRGVPGLWRGRPSAEKSNGSARLDSPRVPRPARRLALPVDHGDAGRDRRAGTASSARRGTARGRRECSGGCRGSAAPRTRTFPRILALRPTSSSPTRRRTAARTSGRSQAAGIEVDVSVSRGRVAEVAAGRAGLGTAARGGVRGAGGGARLADRCARSPRSIPASPPGPSATPTGSGRTPG